jgi:uncharacterized membrane protein YuzA (DUF378 family)
MDSQQKQSSVYLSKLLYKYAVVLLLLGAINVASIGLFRFNFIVQLLGDGFLSKLLYGLIGISALALMFDRDAYLPFLGSTVVPCTVLEHREPPGATKEIQVAVEPNKKVIYWAAEPRQDTQVDLANWEKAYGNYENTGVTTSNANGIAVLKIREPQPYTVPFRGRLESHVHYRVCGEPGWMGEIKTVNIAEPEPFDDIEVGDTL